MLFCKHRKCFNCWKLHNNPVYHGSSSPEILVLGFSKAANQNKAAPSGDFDKIAFANARHRLQIILEKHLGLCLKIDVSSI